MFLWLIKNLIAIQSKNGQINLTQKSESQLSVDSGLETNLR